MKLCRFRMYLITGSMGNSEVLLDGSPTQLFLISCHAISAAKNQKKKGTTVLSKIHVCLQLHILLKKVSQERSYENFSLNLTLTTSSLTCQRKGKTLFNAYHGSQSSSQTMSLSHCSK